MTRVRCFVRTCKNASYKKDSHCSFHDFPSDKKLAEKWLTEIIKYEELCGWLHNCPLKTTAHSKICSDHFEKQCFLDLQSKMKRLNPTAVPTIFPSPFQSDESVNFSGKSYSAINRHFLEEERRVNIFGSDHTYGRTVIPPVQQQKEFQPIEVVQLEDSLTDQEDDVNVIPLVRATMDSLSVTPPRAPYDLTGRMIEEPKKTLAVKRISASKPAVALPTPATSSNQGLITYGRTVIQPYIAHQQKEIQAILQKCGGSVADREVGGIPIKRARINPPLITRPKAPYDLTGRIEEEPEKTLSVNRISASEPVPALPISTSASNQEFVIIFTPDPTNTAALPAQNSNYYQAPTSVASSVVASKAVTKSSDSQQDKQQLVEERIVEPNPGTCKPTEKKEMTQKAIDRRNKAYANQQKLVRQLRHRVEQMEKTHAKLLNTVGFALYERSKKDVRVKRIFRSIEAILLGDDNGEDHPAFLIDQILNFNAATPAQAKYSRATMRSCITLNAKSSSTYDFIRNQGVIILPSRNTLVKCMKKASAKEDGDVDEQEADGLDGHLTLHMSD